MIQNVIYVWGAKMKKLYRGKIIYTVENKRFFRSPKKAFVTIDLGLFFEENRFIVSEKIMDSNWGTDTYYNDCTVILNSQRNIISRRTDVELAGRNYTWDYLKLKLCADDFIEYNRQKIQI